VAGAVNGAEEVATLRCEREQVLDEEIEKLEKLEKLENRRIGVFRSLASGTVTGALWAYRGPG
jgi:hypothetical protein